MQPESSKLPGLVPMPQLIEWRDGIAGLEPLRHCGEISSPAEGRKGETYELEVNSQGASLFAGSNGAARLGEQTWRQLRRQTPNGSLPFHLKIQDYPALSIRAVHVDLKMFAPRFDWLLNWLEQLAAWKLNTIVIEYEDKFPYQKLGRIASRSAWSPDQVREFVARAGQLGIEVIPLIQCLAHLEYVLAHDEYARLRELPHVYSQACPSNPGTLELFKAMASEVIRGHPNLRYLHIGADETCFLGRCPACSAQVRERGKVALFTSYVARICEWVAAQGVRPLLWDDIVRRQPERVKDLPQSSILVYWTYATTSARSDRSKRSLRMPDLQGILVSEKKDERDKAPPYAIYRAAGYDVLMAPCFSGGGLLPDVTMVPANCRFLAEEAALHGCLGLLSTSRSLLFTTLAQSYHGLAATADAAWNPLQIGRASCRERV